MGFEDRTPTSIRSTAVTVAHACRTACSRDSHNTVTSITMSTTAPPEQQRVPRSSPNWNDEIEVLGNGTGPEAGEIEKPPLEDEGVVMRSPFDDMSFVRTFKVFWKAELIAFIAAFSAAAE